jgi:hypothetical protein
MTDKAIIITLAAFLAAAPAVSAQTADVTGTWTATFDADGRTYPATMVLKEDGEKASGTITSDRGDTTITGTVTGRTVAFAFTTSGENGPIPIAMKGDVDGDTMKGTFDYGSGVGTWNASRGTQQKEPPKSDAPATKFDVTGEWAFSIELPNISATPTVVLKQDGESLTGEYQSAQYGKFPLKGTIKGDTIDFGFEMTIEGNALSVSYSGTVVDKDSMEGEVSYGGLADGTFTAARRK